VWAPAWDEGGTPEPAVRLHRLPGHFGPRALIALDRAFAQNPGGRLLVQYVPHSFGLKAMNLPFCYWLYSRRHWNIDVMFHEVAFQRRSAQPLRHNLLGEVTSLMAKLVARSAQRIFVASMAWERMLRSLVKGLGRIEWLPVPSNIAVAHDQGAVRKIKMQYGGEALLIGHFGTYGPGIREYLLKGLLQLIDLGAADVMLLGRGGTDFRAAMVNRYPALKNKLHASGALPPEA